MELLKILSNTINEISSLKSCYALHYKSLIAKHKENEKKTEYGLIIADYLHKHLFPENQEESLESKYSQENIDVVKSLIIDLKVFEINGRKNIKYRLNDPNNLKDKYILNPNKAIKIYKSSLKSLEITSNNAIIMLIIKFEECVSNIFKYLVNKYPEAYLSDKSIPYTDLLKDNMDMDNLKKYMIDKTVESIMMDSSFRDWFDKINSNHKIKIDKTNEYYTQFNELYARRNIIVHNNCKVNKKYLTIINNQCNDNVGDSLTPCPGYVLESFRITEIIIYELFIKLSKICDVEKELQKNLFDIGFTHMMLDEWNISEFIYKHLKAFNNIDESDMLYNKINYWISLKNLSGLDSIIKEVEAFDDSAKLNKFKIAKNALLNNFSKLNELLEESIEKDFYTKDIDTWPLFIQYRKSEEYKDFRNKHSDLFERLNFDSEEITFSVNLT